MAVAIICVLSLAACGGQAAPSSTAPAPASPAAVSAPASAPVSASAAASSKPAASAAAAASAKPGEKMITVYTTPASLFLPLWMADEHGIFARNGLNVEVRLVSNSSAAMASLLSNEVQVFQAGGSDILAAVAGGADLVAVATMAPVYPYKLMVPADIKTPADLKGKKVAIAGVGDVNYIAMRLSLQKVGLDPDKDVTMVPVGGTPQRAAALVGGAVQGELDSVPNTVALEEKGFHSLFDVYSLGLVSANQVLGLKRDYVNSHRDAVQRYVDSMIEGFTKVKEDEPASIALLKEHYKSDDTHAMQLAYDFATHGTIADLPYPRADQFADSVTYMAKTNPAVAKVDVASILDDSFVKSAEARKVNLQPVP
ncbi:MAG TPA: ABC transporter substrate-binding protein [Chloroflexota bacterium]|nr:ABC transporter substrate-binding protein [Chloroflexota bacterium]